MITLIKGQKIEINPTRVILDVNDVGYEIKISLRTYSKIKDLKNINIYTHLVIKEDSHTLFGFYNRKERKTFLSLISISGVGPSTAIIVISLLSRTSSSNIKLITVVCPVYIIIFFMVVCL